MKVRLSFLSLIITVALLTLSACVASPSPTSGKPTATTQSPVSEVKPQTEINSDMVLKMVERLNAGDVEGSMAYFADNAMGYIIGLPSTGIEVYKGKAQIGYVWKDSVDNHFEWEVKIDGAYANIVNLKTKTWHDFTRQIGVAPLEWYDVFEIKDGKIITYGSWLTEDSLARVKEAFAKTMPLEPTPTVSSDPPVTEITVTIKGGRCVTDWPVSLKAGDVKVTLTVEDTDNSKYAFTLFNLDEGKDLLDLMVSTFGNPPSWGDMILHKELDPGSSQTYDLTLQQKPVYLICWSKPPDLPIGNAGPFMVVP